MDADGGLSLWQTNTSGNAPKPYLVRNSELPFLFPTCLFLVLSVYTIVLSSRCLPVTLIFVYSSAAFSITVTITNRLLCFFLPDVAVPQQDSSRLCLRGLLLPHCHCGSFNRQQVQETWRENLVYSHFQKLPPTPKWFLFLLIKSWIVSIELHCTVAKRDNDNNE